MDHHKSAVHRRFFHILSDFHHMTSLTDLAVWRYLFHQAVDGGNVDAAEKIRLKFDFQEYNVTGHFTTKLFLKSCSICYNERITFGINPTICRGSQFIYSYNIPFRISLQCKNYFKFMNKRWTCVYKGDTFCIYRVPDMTTEEWFRKPHTGREYCQSCVYIDLKEEAIECKASLKMNTYVPMLRRLNACSALRQTPTFVCCAAGKLTEDMLPWCYFREQLLPCYKLFRVDYTAAMYPKFALCLR